MKNLRKLLVYTAVLILASGMAAALDINSSQSLNYFNDGQLQFQVDTTGNIQSYGNLDLGNNQLQSFFGSSCPSGEAMVDVNNDGSFTCTDISNEVSGDYVSRSGDSMTGNLDMQGNDILTSNSMAFTNHERGDLGGENGTMFWDLSAGMYIQSGNAPNYQGEPVLLWSRENFNAGTDMNVNYGGEGQPTLNHADTSSQGNVGTSGGTVLSGIDLDGRGHLTNINTRNVDSRYVQRSGDKMTGSLDIGSPGYTGGTLDVGGGANFNGDVNLNNGGGLRNIDNIEMDGRIYGAGVDMSLQEVGSVIGPKNGDTDLNIRTQGSGSHVVSIEDGSSNADIARFKEGTQNVEIPNGNLNVNGNLITNHYGSACPSGEAMVDVNNDGSYQCTDISNEVSGDYVSRNGDSMTGNLDMQGNNVVNMGQYSTSGRDLRGNGGGRAMVTFQNSGSPTTMTINHNGDYNKVDLGSKIDMNSNKITSLQDPSNAQDAATKSYVDNNDDTGTDSQTLSTTADISGTDDEIAISNGNSITVDDDYETDTNTDASTKCGSDQVLEGGNNCVSNYESGDDGDSDSSNELQGLSDVANRDSSLNSGETIDASSGTFRLPVGNDAY